MQSKNPQSSNPLNEKSITFVVPVYGSSGLFLPRCLYSLIENQDYPHKDIIVVFDGEEEGTQDPAVQAVPQDHHDGEEPAPGSLLALP